MEGVESKSQSPGQDTQIMPENSVFVAENVDGFQHCVNEILNLVEHNEKKSKLTTLVTELSRMHMALADENVHLIQEFSKNTQKITTPIKTEYVGLSTSTTPQVTQSSKPVGYGFTLDTDGGGFNISTRKGSESSFGLSSNSESESSVSINKHLKSKLKETKVHDPDALLKKIKTLEKEQISLKKQIKNLTDENALLEAEKSNVPDLKHMISESNRKIETTGKVLDIYKMQVLKAEDENLNLKEELSRKVAYQTQLASKLESIEKIITLLNEKLDAQQARESKLLEQVHSSIVDISKRDDKIKELNNQINLLNNSHAIEEDKWNTDIERLNTEIREKCELIDDLNQKHDELKLKVVELERDVVDKKRELTKMKFECLISGK